MKRQSGFTPRSKKVMELALREALSFGHNYIGTEHPLLGVVREAEGMGAVILLDLGADLETLRNLVIEMLSAPRRRVTPLRAPSDELRQALTALSDAATAALEAARANRDEERGAMIAHLQRLVARMPNTESEQG